VEEWGFVFRSTGTFGSAHSARGVRTGTHYAELTFQGLDTRDQSASFGIIRTGTSLTEPAGAPITVMNPESGGWSFRDVGHALDFTRASGTGTDSGVEFKSGDVIGVLVALDLGQLHIHKNGQWVKGDPLRGAQGYRLAVAPELSTHLGVQLGEGGSVELNVGQKPFRFPNVVPPSASHGWGAPPAGSTDLLPRGEECTGGGPIAAGSTRGSGTTGGGGTTGTGTSYLSPQNYWAPPSGTTGGTQPPSTGWTISGNCGSGGYLFTQHVYDPHGHVLVLGVYEPLQRDDSLTVTLDAPVHTLVLSSYEPVRWRLRGPFVGLVQRVVLRSYNGAAVSGVSCSIVSHLPFGNGSSAYEFPSTSARALVDSVGPSVGPVHTAAGCYQLDGVTVR
jgi:hypothetical protein